MEMRTVHQAGLPALSLAEAVLLPALEAPGAAAGKPIRRPGAASALLAHVLRRKSAPAPWQRRAGHRAKSWVT